MITTYNRVMLDLETLDVRPTAAITQIGWCFFNLETRRCSEPRRINVVPDLDRYSVNWKTLQFWMAQEDAARQSVFDGVRVPLVDALQALRRAIDTHLPQCGEHAEVWAMPPDFDIPILDNAFALETSRERSPWKYDATRCVRTICALAGMTKADRVQPDILHDAGCDAVAQVLTVFKAADKLGLPQTSTAV